MFGSFVKFLLIFTTSYYYASAVPCPSDSDPQLQKLLTCLWSAGVNSNNVHTRNSGSEYVELNWQWNTLNGYLQPLAYLVASSVSDIQKAVVCCRSTKIRIVARSGGHSYVKNGFGDSRSLIVDLETLNKISLDPSRMSCEMGGGTRNGLISYKLWEKGFVASQGICPTVGIGGLALGGGYGHFTRLFGYVSDNVIEMEMIDAKGNLLVINNCTNTDLFWALRGGGGGNFGIVSKFKLKMYQAPKSIVYGVYNYSFKDFARFYAAFQSFTTSDIPNNIFCIAEMEENRIRMRIYAANGQQNLEQVSVKRVESFQNSFSFPVATNSSTKLLSHAEFLLTETQMYSPTLLTKPSQLAQITKHNHIGWKKVKSFYVNKILTKAEIAKLQELLTAYLPSAGVLIDFFGGATNNISPSKTAFIHRCKPLYLFQLKPLATQGELPNPTTDAAMKTFYEKTKTLYNHRESYQNYMDQDISDYLTRYYGSNLKRLTEIKRTVDPENIFHYPQSIPVNV